MSQFGWGLIASIIQDQEDVVPAYRWDLEGSPYYWLRPDRLVPNVASSIRFFTYSGMLEYQAGLVERHVGTHSRGGGGPSALTQPPPSSSKDSRQARASAQGGKSGVPARVSTQGSRPRRKSCPKGHYWSYKEKKCMKSKFR